MKRTMGDILFGIFFAAGLIFLFYVAARVCMEISVTDSTSQCEATGKTGAEECKLTLKDGRTVSCVDTEHGTSCDWAHATTRKDK